MTGVTVDEGLEVPEAPSEPGALEQALNLARYSRY